MKRRFLIFLIISHIILNFSPCYSQEFEMPGYINDISACDFDNNGGFDILVTCPYADTLVILFNNGFGGFEINYYEIISLHAICGCVDADSIPDFIAGVGQQYFYKSNGNQSFEDGIPVFYFSGTITVSELIDLNNDGWNDLLYTNTSDEFWGIFKNNEDLTFTNEIIQSGSSTTTPTVGLITDDSLPDIVLTYSAFDRSSVYVNNGNFNFTEVVLEQTFIGEAFVMNIDNQGTEDFAFLISYSKSIALYKFIGNDQFERQANYYAEGDYIISTFLPADFNMDGYDDFTITRGDWWNGSDSLYIYFNDHNWSFYLNQTLYIGEQNWFKSLASDLNGDSFPDIFMKGCNGSNILTLLWNDGTGNFSFENPVLINDSNSMSYRISVFPNPFQDNVRIEVQLTNKSRVSVTMYDLFGKIVKEFCDIESHSPQLQINWDGTDEEKGACPQGIYILTLKSDSDQISKKIVKYWVQKTKPYENKLFFCDPADHLDWNTIHNISSGRQESGNWNSQVKYDH